eukprot:749483-Hanusia_phi.AAC.7
MREDLRSRGREEIDGGGGGRGGGGGGEPDGIRRLNRRRGAIRSSSCMYRSLPWSCLLVFLIDCEQTNFVDVGDKVHTRATRMRACEMGKSRC